MAKKDEENKVSSLDIIKEYQTGSLGGGSSLDIIKEWNQGREIRREEPKPVEDKKGFMESLKSGIKGAAYGALSGISRLAGEAAKGGYQLERYIVSPLVSPIVGKEKWEDELKAGEARANKLIQIADQLDAYGSKKAQGIEKLSYSASKIAPDIFTPLVQNVTKMVKAPVEDKSIWEKTGDVLGGFGSIIAPGEAILGGFINVPFNVLDIAEGKKSIYDAYSDGVSLGAKLGPISGLTSKVLSPVINPLLNKLGVAEVSSIKAAIQAIKNEANPVFKASLQKQLMRDIVGKVGKETINNALGNGVYESLLPAKDSGDRVENFVEGVKIGALFGGVLTALGIGGDALFGKAQSFTPLTKEKIEELKNTAGSYTPLTKEFLAPVSMEKELKMPIVERFETKPTTIAKKLKLRPTEETTVISKQPVKQLSSEQVTMMNDVQNTIQDKWGSKLDIFDADGVLKSQADIEKEIKKKIDLKDKSMASIVFHDIKNAVEYAKSQYETLPSQLKDIPEPTVAPTSVTLRAEIVPGAEKVVKETLMTVREGIDAASKIVDEVQKNVVPTSIGKAKKAAGILRELQSSYVNTAAIEALQNKKLEQELGKFTDEQFTVMIDNYERTGLFGKGMETYSKIYKESMNDALDIINSVFEKKPIEGVENYVRRMFKFGNKQDEQKFVEGFGKTFQGFSTSPFKKRIFEYMSEAEAYMQKNNIKYDVATRNPELLRQWTINNARKLKFFDTAFKELKESELIKFVKGGKEIPAGMTKLDDRFAKVFFKGEQGMVQAGQYFAPDEVARLMNNYTSKSALADSPTWEAIREFNNALNAVQLGFDGFQILVNTTSSLASDLALAAEELAGGKVMSAGKRTLKSMTIVWPAIEDYMVGRKLIDGVSQGKKESLLFMQEVFNPAGARLQMEERYRIQAADKFKAAWEKGSIKGVAWHFMPMLAEKAAQPIVENILPMMKIGRFYKEANSYLLRATDNYTKTIDKNVLREQLFKRWESIDSFHGQMVQDNLFWNNTQKDVANIFFRAFGWTYSKIQSVGTALSETSQTVGAAKYDIWQKMTGQAQSNQLGKLISQRGGVLTPTMAKVMMYPIAIAYTGAVYQYLHTGKAPESYLDYFFPRNGELNNDGTESRVSIPGYMKDMFSYAHNPVQTILNKTSPEIQLLTQLFQNKDYYNVMIRNENDPLVKQTIDMGQYALNQYTPFAFRNFMTGMQETEKGANTVAQAGMSLLNSFFGFYKAPKYVVQTDTEQKIGEEFRRVVGIKTYTPQEWEVVLRKSKAKAAARGGDYDQLKALLEEGVYTKQGYKMVKSSIEKNLKSEATPFQSLFAQLPESVQKSIWDKMTPEEQSNYEPFAKKGMFKLIESGEEVKPEDVPIY